MDYKDTLPYQERQEWLAARDADPYAYDPREDRPTKAELAEDEREYARARRARADATATQPDATPDATPVSTPDSPGK